MSLEISYQGVSLVEEDILKKVIEQLNKDLMLSGLEYEFAINSEKKRIYSGPTALDRNYTK